MEAKLWKIDGMIFRLKPTSRVNYKTFVENFSDPATYSGADDFVDEWVEVMKLLVDPVGEADFDKIDRDNLDVKIIDEMLLSFVPSLPTAIGVATASLRS